MANYQAVTNQAQNVAATPYQAYSGQLVAPVNGQQTSGINAINSASGIQNGYNAGATGLAAASSAIINPEQFSGQALGQYENPYQSQVVNATEAELQQQNQQQAAALQSQSIASGAFGGDRAGIAQAALAGQQDIANNATIAGLNSQNFQNAESEFNTQQATNLSAQQNTAARQLAASQQLGSLGNTAQGEALTEANAQTNAGTLQQTTQQAQDTAAYNQFLQQQAYPFQTTGWLANIVEGIGSQSGGTSTGQQTQDTSTGSSILGGLIGLGSFLKDGGRVVRKAGGGGLLIPYAGAESGIGSGSIVPTTGLAVGHTMPNGAMGGVGGQSATQQGQGIAQTAKAFQGLGDAFENSSLGDSFNDAMQDIGDGFSRGGLVKRDDGGLVDPTMPTPDAIAALKAAYGVAPAPTDDVPVPPARPAGLGFGTLNAYRAQLTDPSQPVVPSDTYAEPVAGGVIAPTDLRFQDRIQDLQQDAEDAGIPNLMISGYRSPEKQAGLYAAYRNGTGGMAAPPGLSYHNYGDAADVLARDPSQQGLLTALASEPWRGITPGAIFGDNDHYQIAGARPSGASALAAAAPSDDATSAVSAYGPSTAPRTDAALAAIDHATPSNGDSSFSAPSPSSGLGGLFGSTGTTADTVGLLGLHMSPQMRQGLLAMGLGAMAGTSRNPFVNIGQGGLQGLAAFNQARNLETQMGLRQAQIQHVGLENQFYPQVTQAGLAKTQADTGLAAAEARKAKTEAQRQQIQLDMLHALLDNHVQEQGVKAKAVSDAAEGQGAAPVPSVTPTAPPAQSGTPAPAVRAPVGTPTSSNSSSAPKQIIPQDDPEYHMQRANELALAGLGPAAENEQKLAQAIRSGQIPVRFTDGSSGIYPGALAAIEAKKSAETPAVDPLTGAKYFPAPGGPTKVPSPSVPAASGAPSKFSIDPITAKVSTAIPAAPPGGGYIQPNVPAGAKITELPETTKKQMDMDGEFQKDQVSTMRATPTVIARTQAIAQAFKTFQSGSLTDKQHDAAALATALGFPSIAQGIMKGSISGPEWVDKEGVQSVLDTLKSATPRFAQSEFNAVASHGTPNTTNQPEANHEMVAEMLALGQRNDAFMKDWESAKRQGWSSPSAFYEAWDAANPLPGFIRSAQRQIGNFVGMDLPPAKDWAAGTVYVAPKTMSPGTAGMLGKYGVKPGMMFRYNGAGNAHPVAPIGKSEMFSAQLGQ